MQLRFGVLHGKIRPLHESNLDAPTTSLETILRPGDQLIQGRVRIGQIRLKHDARGQRLKLGLG